MPLNMKPAKPDIRRKILHYLKTRGKALIPEIARHFRMSHEGARKQIVLMETEGWVNREKPSAPPGGIGRPNAEYSLTSAGDHLFPKAYGQLSIAVITVLKENLGPATLERLLGHPVVREERFQAGHGRCVFRVQIDRPLPKKGFRFESEKAG